MKNSPNFPRYMFLLTLACLFCNTSFSQATDDAVVITLRIQQGIRLDTVIAAAVDSGLTAARKEFDTLSSIHLHSMYVPDELIVATNAPWSESWRRGEIPTGEHYIDSLDVEYDLIRVDTLRGGGFMLVFAHPLEMRRLASLYSLQSGIIFTEPNYYFGDGDGIEYFKKNDTMHFAFSHGWEDCPSGCIERHYWYVSVARGDSALEPLLDEEKSFSWSQPYIYRWNIPAAYEMTMFPDADSIFRLISASPVWWMRRHAVEGTWRFFIDSLPWAPAENAAQWKALRNELLSRRQDVLDVLHSASADPDSDVSASARNAALHILALPVKKEVSKPSGFLLEQNHPNPFNPSTTICYSIPRQSHVALKIFDLLGREVATLIEGEQTAGYKSVTWDAANVPSGVYFYRLQAGGFTETKRLLLIR